MMKLSLVLATIGLAFLLLSAMPGLGAAPAAQPTAAMPAAATATPAAAPEADIAYGKALFSAKGCVTCHHHAALPGSGFGPGSTIPDLTTYRWEADYLRAWLKNPAAVRPDASMPNLGLKQDEIESLIAFLSAGAQ
jgi:cytochrome c2